MLSKDVYKFLASILWVDIVFGTECIWIPGNSILYGKDCENMTNVVIGAFPIPAYAHDKVICHTNIDSDHNRTNIYSIQCKSKDECTYTEYNYKGNNPLNCSGDITRTCMINLGGDKNGIIFKAECAGIIQSFYFTATNHTGCDGEFDGRDLNNYLLWYQNECNQYYNGIAKCEQNSNPVIYLYSGTNCTGDTAGVIKNGTCEYNSVEGAYEQIIITDNPCP